MFMIPGTVRFLLEFILVIFSVQDDMARSSNLLTYAFVEHVLTPYGIEFYYQSIFDADPLVQLKPLQTNRLHDYGLIGWA
jgi:hypothetical protein